MKSEGTKRRTPIDDESLKPRTRRKDIPEDFEDDDIEDGYDVINQEGDNLPDNAN